MKVGLLLITISILLSGCFPEYQAAQAQAQRKKTQKEVAKIMDDLMKSDEDIDDYIYTSENRRDPFLTLVMERANANINEETIKEGEGFKVDNATQIQVLERISELQRFEIDELKLTAIIYGTSARRALLVDPTNKSHIVREGQIIGRNFGRIAAIKRDRLVIKEETYDMQRRKINRNVVILIDKEKER